jgi:hypothetical protein
VRQEGPLPPRRVAEIGHQVLGALRAVHAKGILHRDVKPSNVLVTEDRAVLTDFGLAALEGDTSITQAGIVLGSAGYIAPERVLGDRASSAADLWSLGATLYTAVEGRGLHGRRTAAAALAALTSGEPIPMELAGPLAPVLRGLLQIDPAARLDEGRASLMLARVAAGGSAEEPLGGPARRMGRAPTATATRGGMPPGSPMSPARSAMGSTRPSSGGAFPAQRQPAGGPPASSRRTPHRGQHRADRAIYVPPPGDGAPVPRGQRRPIEGLHRKSPDTSTGRRRSTPGPEPAAFLERLFRAVRTFLAAFRRGRDR